MKPIDLHLLNAEAKFKEAINHAFDLGWDANQDRIIKLLEEDAGECIQTKPMNKHLDDYCNCRLIALIKGEK